MVAPSCGAETKLNVGGCTTTNLPLCNGIKVISILKHLNGKVFSTNSTIQKCDVQMKKQTKNICLLLAAHEVGASPYSAQRSVPFLHLKKFSTSNAQFRRWGGVLKIWGNPPITPNPVRKFPKFKWLTYGRIAHKL